MSSMTAIREGWPIQPVLSVSRQAVPESDSLAEPISGSVSRKLTDSRLGGFSEMGSGVKHLLIDCVGHQRFWSIPAFNLTTGSIAAVFIP